MGEEKREEGLARWRRGGRGRVGGARGGIGLGALPRGRGGAPMLARPGSTMTKCNTIQVLAIKNDDAPDQRATFGFDQRADGECHLGFAD